MKIIKDRDDRPKGFGYIEFVELDGLKDALAKSGTVSCNLNLNFSKIYGLVGIPKQAYKGQRGLTSA